MFFTVLLMYIICIKPFYHQGYIIEVTLMNWNQTKSELGRWSNFGYITGHWKREYGTIGWKGNDINDGIRVLSVLSTLKLCWEITWGWISFDTGKTKCFCWTACPFKNDVLLVVSIKSFSKLKRVSTFWALGLDIAIAVAVRIFWTWVSLKLKLMLSHNGLGTPIIHLTK